MSRKGILYILLVLGLVTIGGGVWMLYNSVTQDTIEDNPVTVNIPKSDAVIYEQVRYLMGGVNHELWVYNDGSIIYITENRLRFPSPEYPATRIWNTGNLTAEQVNSLLDYLENSGLDEMEDHYEFAGEPVEGGGTRMSDMGFTLIVNSDNLSKKITAFGYLTPDKGAGYPDMPSPLNKIYGRLRTIAEATEEICEENIK